jgi:hypothetical protein
MFPKTPNFESFESILYANRTIYTFKNKLDSAKLCRYENEVTILISEKNSKRRNFAQCGHSTAVWSNDDRQHLALMTHFSLTRGALWIRFKTRHM